LANVVALIGANREIGKQSSVCNVPATGVRPWRGGAPSLLVATLATGRHPCVGRALLAAAGCAGRRHGLGC